MATRDIYETSFDEDVSGENTAACPECDGQVRTNTVETTCEDCGLVIDEHRIDHGPEWRSFADDEEFKERTGAPLTAARHDRGLSTEIGRGGDANENRLSIKKRRQLGRLRREHARGRWRSKAERNLGLGLEEVRRIASALGLSMTMRDQACQLFRSAQQERLLVGRSIEAIAAASVYGACRCNGRPTTLAEVVGVARVAGSRVTNAYKTLNSELGLSAIPIRPQCFVPKLTTELEASEDVRRRALSLAQRARETDIANGCQPTGVAAACVYMASLEDGRSLTQSMIAEAAGTTPTTLRARWKDLQEEVRDRSPNSS
jgi:transcription initiation factor TFIIB